MIVGMHVAGAASYCMGPFIIALVEESGQKMSLVHAIAHKIQ